MRNKISIAVLLLCTLTFRARAQQSNSLADSLQAIPSKYYTAVQKKCAGIEDKLTKKSLKYLEKFQRQQQKLQARLAAMNPQSTAGNITNEEQQYKDLTAQLKSKAAPVSKVISGSYNANLDSVGTSLSFLKQFNGISSKAGQPLQTLNELQGRLAQTDKIKEYIEQQKSHIKELLSKFTTLPSGFKNEYTRLNKTAYYYSAQVQEYKAMLHDPDKMEQKTMGILNKIPAFQKFWQKNSQIAQLFPMPAGYGTVQALGGLQTNVQVQQQAMQQLGVSTSGTGNINQYVQHQMDAAQSSLNQLKDKVGRLGGTTGSGNMDLPDFKPDGQKTKTFLKRLEYGVNIQNVSKTSFMPAVIDIGLSLGYKFSDKITAGAGSSYKLGLGNGIEHIHITSEGVSLRSYLDIKAKGSFWLSAGWEYNYYQSFSKLTDLKNTEAWQKSALIGVKKKYKVGKKDGSIQFLYDLLASGETPRAQPLKFRIGYSF